MESQLRKTLTEGFIVEKKQTKLSHRLSYRSKKGREAFYLFIYFVFVGKNSFSLDRKSLR